MAEIKSLEENNAPREKREKLITGEAKTRKRLGDVFIAEDVQTVKNHIFMDVVVPAIKTVIVDIVTNGIQMMLWGDTINRGKAPGTKYNYGNCYSSLTQPQRTQKTNYTGYGYEDPNVGVTLLYPLFAAPTCFSNSLKMLCFCVFLLIQCFVICDRRRSRRPGCRRQIRRRDHRSRRRASRRQSLSSWA